MRGARGRRPLLALVAAILLASAVEGRAERRATRTFSTADGLASDYIVDIHRDSSGFLWFATREGLSRFDGTRFTTYGTVDGLPHATVNCVLETRAGHYWIGTNGGGVARFNPRGQAGQVGNPLFAHYPVGPDRRTARVNVLYEDRAGRIWAGTDGGLFRLDSAPGSAFVSFDLTPALERTAIRERGVGALLEDPEGSLWIGTVFGLVRRLPDGRLVLYDLLPHGPRSDVGVLALEPTGRLWASYFSGILVLDIEPVSAFSGGPSLVVRTIARPPAPSSPPVHARWLTDADGLPTTRAASILVTSQGHVWVGTTAGAVEFAGETVRVFTARNGLVDNYVAALAEDQAGNIWFGTPNGVTRLVPRGLVTFDLDDGLSSTRIHALGQDTSGRLYVVAADYEINRLEHNRFSTARPRLPPESVCNWTCPFGVVDRSGGWWMLSTRGLYHFGASPFERLGAISPDVLLPSRNGLATDNVFRLFEDRSGHLWVGGYDGGIARFSPGQGSWRTFGESDGLPPLARDIDRASAFAEDRDGNLWVGFYEGGVARLREGRFQVFGAADGVPSGFVTALSSDRAGRLWIASSQQGLARVDDPSAARPAFKPLTVAHGLASNNVRCLVEDEYGRTYAGTTRGVDRIDAATGEVRHYGVGEGLASDFVTSALRDRTGALWFGTAGGLSRLDPIAPGEPATELMPRVLIGAIRVGGVARPLSELGDPAPERLTLSPNQNQVEIDFFAVNFTSGNLLRYQYRLEGGSVDADAGRHADAVAGWSPVTDLRRVNYARLASGSYRFLVRGVRSDGSLVPSPAVVSFTVLPPIYLRWWFISLALGLAAGAAAAAYQIRVRHLLRVERVRARIATDLHDDIGASLSQIAILAEVARRQPRAELAGDPLARIAETSRGLVDSMSDIVWAVNPEADSLGDLVQRMRRFAEDTLSAADVELTFLAAGHESDRHLGPDVRREILLILKESVTNIAKHARCRNVTIEFEGDRQRLQLRVADDGIGFDAASATDGNGVASMRRRVAALGGQLAIDSVPGRGTTIVLVLDRRRLPDHLRGLLQP